MIIIRLSRFTRNTSGNMKTYCDHCKKIIDLDKVFKDRTHYYCEECFNKQKPELASRIKFIQKKKIVFVLFYLILYTLIIWLRVTEGIEEADLKNLLTFINLPLIYVLFKVIFGDLSTVKEALTYWAIPNILFKYDDRQSAKGAEIALILIPLLYYLIIIGEVKLIYYLLRL